MLGGGREDEAVAADGTAEAQEGGADGDAVVGRVL